MAGKLPRGLKFTSGKHGQATISGTAAHNARGKTFLLTFKAVNSRGSTTQHFSLTVS